MMASDDGPERRRSFLRLPINGDEGFPQAFRVAFRDRTYAVLLYVNVLEADTETPEDHVYELPAPGAFMVIRVTRETAGGPRVILQRKLVPNLEYEAAEVAFVFRQMRVARRNLNGIGAHGSQVVGGIAER
jgi:hypothetical protein